ncbi:MAG: hypothetical protein AVDCRST_MAG03-319 [uncultured Rubrobacteraceae bacterium]|uniref:Uncharacterized protein n=1 Tax=uncultured Rubrobacteraceae bacterium TaxID=349277 RepID=A0A6J4NFX6_9ACTN|nr:MAG: hypothetical protein AVDCRST_MAG03-319 [uncultured Rubrobacteraceae bacterium]
MDHLPSDGPWRRSRWATTVRFTCVVSPTAPDAAGRPGAGGSVLSAGTTRLERAATPQWQLIYSTNPAASTR